jgi:hypothetical protein
MKLIPKPQTVLHNNSQSKLTMNKQTSTTLQYRSEQITHNFKAQDYNKSAYHTGHHAGTDWYQLIMVKSQQPASRIIHSKGRFRGRGARTHKVSPRITGTDWYRCTKPHKPNCKTVLTKPAQYHNRVHTIDQPGKSNLSN